MNGTDRDADCSSWYGLKFPGLDCADWLPYMDAVDVGMIPERKITIPLHVIESPKNMATVPNKLVGVDTEPTAMLRSLEAS